MLSSGPTGEILAVMVNFMCQLTWTTGAQIFGQILLSVSGGCFCMRLTIEQADWVELIATPLPM